MEFSAPNHKFPQEVKMKDFPKKNFVEQSGYPQGYEHNLKQQNEVCSNLSSKSVKGGTAGF